MGRSTTGAPGQVAYCAEDLSDDLLAVIEAHGGSAHVVGMSLGGYLGQMAALRRPDAVRSLTLIGSEPLGGDAVPLPGIDGRFMSHFERLADLDWEDRASVTEFLVEIARLCAGSARPFDARAARALARAEMARAWDHRCILNHGGLRVREDWTGRVRDIRLPVLVLHGSEDPILPLENGRSIARQVPDARLVVLEGVGHELPPADLPRLVEEITGFVREHRAGTGPGTDATASPASGAAQAPSSAVDRTEAS